MRNCLQGNDSIEYDKIVLTHFFCKISQMRLSLFVYDLDLQFDINDYIQMFLDTYIALGELLAFICGWQNVSMVPFLSHIYLVICMSILVGFVMSKCI